MKTLTIALTIYKPTNKELVKWSQIFDSIKDERVEKIVISDNPTLIDVEKNFSSDVKYHVNKINLGKARTVVEVAKISNSKFLKTVDPDDSLGKSNITKLIDELEKTPNSIVIHPYFVSFFKKKPRMEYRGPVAKTSNWFSIWPTQQLKEVKIKFTKTFGEDQTIGNKLISMGSDVKSIKTPFYKYNFGVGMTTLDKNTPKEVVDNYSSEVEFFLSEIKDIYPDITNKEIKTILNYPMAQLRKTGYIFKM